MYTHCIRIVGEYKIGTEFIQATSDINLKLYEMNQPEYPQVGVPRIEVGQYSYH